ncbi:hypothetical protein RUM43_007649 [Polyplax serrata]|uniref:Uncharacterized protein n=1 Tax=Polyplax serrata TaxID=468196 RepID=A0AAN8SA80_POLSC
MNIVTFATHLRLQEQKNATVEIVQKDFKEIKNVDAKDREDSRTKQQTPGRQDNPNIVFFCETFDTSVKGIIEKERKNSKIYKYPVKCDKKQTLKTLEDRKSKSNTPWIVASITIIKE